MIVSPASFSSSFPALIRVSGELCPMPVSWRQDSFGNASDQPFDAPELCRVLSRLRFQLCAGLPITAKNPFNTQ
jgi:hypothetical protein